VGVPSIDCSTIERAPFHATTDTGLVRCAQRDWHAVAPEGGLTLDGTALNATAGLVTTSAFDFSTPPNDNMFGVPGRTSGRAAVEGYVTILRPLSVGRHTLVTDLRYGSAQPERYTYKLTSN
jgi:hypothetical protein